ncbi:MAG: 16S rRNA processing protein RimM [Deltaproteobacteria bacterium]|nr:16S rRNA processing protein RimM [Deltaproteobacteria bacterium]
MPRPADHEWVPLAVVGRPHGVRGEVRAHPFNRDSDLLLELDEVLVRFVEGERQGEEHEVSIDDARAGNDAILLKLHGVDDRDAADDVRGAHLCARRGDFPALEEGEFYASDIIGAAAVLDGATVGRVDSFTSYPSVDILLVTTNRGRFEIPLVDAYVDTVDPAGEQVVLRTLEGLEPIPLRRG